jgi:hypothetical protein
MPDWSYRTVLRPTLLSLGPNRARRLAIGTLSRLSRFPFGPAAIDFLGHMRADERLRTRCGAIELAGPIALGGMIDPGAEAIGALARFGVGLIEVGPVAEQANAPTRDWRVDVDARTVTRSHETVVSVDEVERNLTAARSDVPIVIRIADGADARAIANRLKDRAAMFSVGTVEQVAAIADVRPTLLRIVAGQRPAVRDSGTAGGPPAMALAAIRAGAVGVWVDGDNVTEIRSAVGADAVIVATGVTEPDDARRLLDAGANVVVIDAGLICSGPGLPKRCNEALLSRLASPGEPDPLTIDAARRAWFWALLLGAGMFFGGILALLIASTRVVLPYDEQLCGMTRAELARLNPRLLPFMAHDRVSLAGTMLSIGIFYAALAWFGIRRGAHWAHVTLLASATIGFFSFFLFLGFGYFDPFHAFVTAILTQFTLLCMVLPPSPRQPPAGEWRETAAWRRGQWGQLLFILIGAALTGAGLVIAAIGCTAVFVHTDLEFMRTTAAQLGLSYQHLVPLVAHDRASLGGMLIANGVAVWLSAQWGFRAGTRWLWLAFAWGGNLAFASAVTVHFVVGYGSPLHLFPALLGWVTWNVGLALTKEWMSQG